MIRFVRCFSVLFGALAIVGILHGVLWAFNADRMRIATAQKKKTTPSKPPVSQPTVDMEKQFPLQAGNYWVYKSSIEIGNEHGTTTKSDVPRRVQVISANNDGKQTIVKLRNEDFNGSDLITYVIRGRRVYEFDQFDSPGSQTQRDLPDEKLRYVFPLGINQKWGEADKVNQPDGLYCYVVEGVDNVTVPAGAFSNCSRIAFRSIADELVQWFKPGVGVVKSTYHHNGSVDDELYELEAFKLSSETKIDKKTDRMHH